MILLLLACPADPVDSATDTGDRWQLPALELSPARPLLSRQVDGLAAPRSLQVLRERPTTLALDDSGTLLVLDAHYEHAATAWCIRTANWPETGDPAWQGDCAEGEVEVRRGVLDPGPPVRAAAIDEAGLRVFALDAEGTVHVASADVLAGDPFAWLRLEPYGSVDVSVVTEGAMAWDGEALHVAVGSTVWELRDAGTTETTLHGNARAVAVVDGEPWWLTSAGLEVDGEVVRDDAVDLVAGPGGAWVGTPDGVVSPEGLVEVAGSTGQVAVDALAGVVWVSTEDGLARIADEVTAVPLDAPVVSIAGGPGHELVVWTGSSVDVYVDELALVDDGAPLDLWATTFVEKPQTPDQPGECGGDEGLEWRVGIANANSGWLADTPATWALGVTPNHLRTARECELVDELRPVLHQPRQEVGLLFHEEPSDCADVACTVDFLREMASELAWFGAMPTWSSALSPLTDLDLDWKAALVEAGAPEVYFFFGLSVLPEVPHHDDPRAKDAYPLDSSALAAGWSDGGLAFYPSNNLPLFNLGGCANQLLLECHQTGQGAGHTLSDDDIAVLDLLLARSLAVRGEGPSTWSFHLPDLGAFDYTEGCSEAEGVWSGEGCQVTLMQEWLTEVHQRYVQNGLARWSLPSEVERP